MKELGLFLWHLPDDKWQHTARVGILPAKTYFCRDSGKNRFLPVFAGFFQNLVKSFKIQNLFQIL